MKNLGNILLIFCLLIVTLFSVSACGDARNAEITISTDRETYNLVVGESVNINVSPSGARYSFDLSSDVATIDDDGNMLGLRIGSAKLSIHGGGATKTVKVNVYDAIVTKDDLKPSDLSRYNSIDDAVSRVNDGSLVLVSEGKYDERVLVDKDITLIGEDNAIMRGIEVAPNRAVKIDNIDFYSREYPSEDEGFVKAHDGASLSVSHASFLVDRKKDNAVDRIGGYGIYVCPYSRLVRIIDCSFSGFLKAVKIEGTRGKVDIIRNSFSSSNVGIIIDIVDYTSPLATNTDASGKVGDNTFDGVEREVEFVFAGESYNGPLLIEKRDKL